MLLFSAYFLLFNDIQIKARRYSGVHYLRLYGKIKALNNLRTGTKLTGKIYLSLYYPLLNFTNSGVFNIFM